MATIRSLERSQSGMDPQNADLEDDETGLFTNRSTVMANFEEWIKMATDNKINSRNSWNFALIDYFYDLNVLRDAENNINFQKASATLDGCVKIYSSRVDSVTSETGKLLSGLAQKKANNKDRNKNAGNNSDPNGNTNNSSGSNDNSNQADDDASNSDNDSIQIDPLTGLPIGRDDNLDENGHNTRRRVYNRVLETTLVDFDSLKMKELDQELNIDPLFKKALVDFDEGGAKSLLLNTLNIDNSIRVIFDASMKDINNADNEVDGESADREEAEEELKDMENIEEDNISENNNSAYSANNTSIHSGFAPIEDEILSLGMDFINFKQLSVCEISSSIHQLRNVVQDINKAKTFIDSVNSNKFDNFLTEEELQETIPDNVTNNDDNNDFDTGIEKELEYSIQKEEENRDEAVGPVALDLGADDNEDDIVGGGQPHSRINDGRQTIYDDNGDGDGDEGNDSNIMMSSIFEQDLMSYFDENLKKNWRGREHWKVRNFKKNNKLPKLLGSIEEEREGGTPQLGEDGNPIEPSKSSSLNTSSTSTKNLQQSAQQQHFEIDFFAQDDTLEEKVFDNAKGNGKNKRKVNIDMPIKNRINDAHFLLPDDYHFSTDKITRLFIKPTERMCLSNLRKRKSKHTANGNFTTRSHTELRTNNNDGNNVAINIENHGPEIANEEFWAENYKRKEAEANQGIDDDADDADGEEGVVDVVGASMDNPFNNFGNGDGDGDDDMGNGIDFNQAFDDDDDMDKRSHDSELSTRDKERNAHFKDEDMKEDYLSKNNKINFSRVAKRVDVRRLKKNIWSSILVKIDEQKQAKKEDSSQDAAIESYMFKFSDIIERVRIKYSKEVLKDISTSFCFICLLHLANEHGLDIEDYENLEDLTVTFTPAVISSSSSL
ncbi:condensin subunit BRN1 NDAI_0E03970 [Naumovozyma dairenensis CBS 421]|uniref:Condensin complex subunit 2 n=1 Tax=Naumovozyma dairenensis (strain ATCC 10597 / BCRC 20456 / CBS 421 / NBRC 0211 / NRRL Y-12639) TaxID=1071378 RepID=G0WBU4_NAUDC|nr:hypothetical protein NDAI_0E03970 [Naumovozyma dairenensis CBS 421]CCD25214.1 hypothetical protein NDAI_0E03970 [Naumovozyma dairenensis CBS 421]